MEKDFLPKVNKYKIQTHSINFKEIKPIKIEKNDKINKNDNSPLFKSQFLCNELSKKTENSLSLEMMSLLDIINSLRAENQLLKERINKIEVKLIGFIDDKIKSLSQRKIMLIENSETLKTDKEEGSQSDSDIFSNSVQSSLSDNVISSILLKFDHYMNKYNEYINEKKREINRNINANMTKQHIVSEYSIEYSNFSIISQVEDDFNEEEKNYFTDSDDIINSLNNNIYNSNFDLSKFNSLLNDLEELNNTILIKNNM